MKSWTLPVACAAALSTAPINARDTDVLTVHAPTAEQWVAGISRSLADNLRYPGYIGRQAAQGAVSISFVCSDDGRPSEVTVISSSRHNLLDQAAVRAVKRLKAMHPLPDGIAEDQRFRADLFFAESEGELRRLQAVSQRRDRLAANGGNLITLTVRAAR